MSTLATIREHGLIAVIDLPIAERVFDWGMAVSKGGIELLGIPATLPNVTEVISDLDDANLTVGLTGVLRAEQVSIAVAAGAEFLITPIADAEVIGSAKGYGLTVIAGALTPTEVHRALDSGADLVSLHPVGAMDRGDEFFRAMLRTFPDTPLVASGRIDVENAPTFLECGAAAAIVDKGVFPDSNDPSATDIISMRAVALVEVCAEALGMPKRSSFTELRASEIPPAGAVEAAEAEALGEAKPPPVPGGPAAPAPPAAPNPFDAPRTTMEVDTEEVEFFDE
ncbi:MAG TPA: bifunctional 4-hydroxy-2-oxoglutarate aldolase/2-dehydro-3-deoxy-phosphogluconate aldolase [Polyangiaceae bacterium LLY-WYZ-15_(1-7)]|nr:bifunctional 4-hydroxy-2-oxoglutarate aldolase/2-dehydro-3-deoxy-phosphogluconate aldolase [Polyangiaceae bacterium LLY-WYZ-15_(1-7)]HJL11835.1 bifunctional 4-hydroxy-2-oxoglutarate aldolase/2-dehydro-3-deoxy-phosphogluconate aldolase [Polyangiaceae bacterium LLY-WYZ-15_(1-7)]HJL25950.1 bifunctional 4-hydroxy-2-oxoglutarate aldolase/2-dehydro-3-deoxy-phosphogluconate aldolase [Polyangiaceae bacterium LLY-WYZ-15_(1-7)]HJL31963.1 bifunctional 4-hydroxy-2-oxoglutarate aldolase/2-dehydro-3-deoxy-